ncbi:MAG: iron ABC transporter substrate-binding protein [Acidimicrobiia bacterium]
MRLPPGRPLTAVFAVALLVTVGSSCSSGDDQLVTVYSGRTKDLIGPLLDRFAQEADVDVEVRYADTAELALLIDTEGDQSPADVFISQSPGAVAFLDSKERLRPLPAGILDNVPAEDHATDGAWIGLSGRVRTLVFNTDKVQEADLPPSVFDLTDPRFSGRIGVAPSNGSFQDFVTAMRVEVGEDRTREWLEGIAANSPRIYPNNVSILEAVGRGEVDTGLINHYYDFRAKAEDPDLPTALHFFEEGDLGGLLLVSAASVLDTTDQGDAAERLVSFLLSPESQRYFAEETQEYPLVAGVEPAAGLPPLDTVASSRIEFGSLDQLSRTVELIRDSGLGR